MTVGAKPKLSREAKIAIVFMFVAAAMNYLDRSLFGVLQEPIKKDLKLTDFELGLLGGPAFAILYTLMAVPISRIADRGYRVRVLVAIISFWSLMTALCGTVTSFMQMLIARLGVSVGESGGTPVSHSILSERFPPQRRAGAISIYTSGGNIGVLCSAFVGGAIGHAYGWRVTFIMCGLVGIILAGLLVVFLKEPPRARALQSKPPSFRAALREFRAKPSFFHLCMGMGVATFSINAILQYMTSFLIRVHDLPLPHAAAITGIMSGGVGFATTILTGIAIDRMRTRLPRIGLLLPTMGTIVGAVAYIIAFVAPSIVATVAALAVGVFFGQSYFSAGWSTAQDLAPPHLRATAPGLVTLTMGLFGVGIGPPLLGFVSDKVADHILMGTGFTARSCVGLLDNGGCAVAQAQGISAGLIVIALPLLWSALHFWLGSRTLPQDMEPVHRRQLEQDTRADQALGVSLN